MHAMASAALPALRFEPLANTREAIGREQLLRQLQPAPPDGARLVLLCAPAGFGKTTLLAQLAQAARCAGQRVAWLNCDARDRDAEVFAEGLGAALRHGLARPAGIDDLAQVDVPLLICIDDYECALGPQADALLEAMAWLASPQVRIVVASREPPRQPLTRLLLDGRARQMDAQLLRFTVAEAQRLLQDTVPPHSLGQILRYADGWPFALQLARLRACAEPSALWPGEASAPIPRRQIFDYLAHEVLATLPQALRDFLADVAVLDLVDVAAANAVRERGDSLALIQQLTRMRPVALVDELAWSVRLHPLLRDYLLDACALRSPGHLDGLHQRAARHLASCGQLHEAVAHAVAGHSPGLGACLLESAGGLLLISSEGAVRSRLMLKLLPASVLQERPRLRLLRMLAQLLQGLPDGVQSEFVAVRQQVMGQGAAGDDAVWQDLAFAELGPLLARSEREQFFSPWAAIGRLRALARSLLLHDRRPMALTLSFEIFFLHRYGPAGRCERRVREVEALFADGAYTRNSPWIWVYRARNALVRGELALAVKTLEESLAQDLNFLEFRQDTLARLSTGLHGQIAYARGDIDSALAHFEALAPVHGTDLLEVLIDGCVGAAACAFAKGQAQRAFEMLGAARQLAQDESLPHLGLAAAAAEVDMLLRCDRTEAAVALAGQAQLERVAEQAREAFALPWAETEAVARACWRLRLARADAAGAAQMAASLLAQSRRSGRVLGELSAQFMLACAHAGQGDGPAANRALGAGLRLGARLGAAQCALDAGAPLLALVHGWLAATHAEPQAAPQVFARQVLALWEQRFGERLGQGGPHRLTPRESDVLRELARQYSTKQIAKALGLSPETVKHHLKRIFAKLGVRSREAALYEARRRAWMA